MNEIMKQNVYMKKLIVSTYSNINKMILKNTKYYYNRRDRKTIIIDILESEMTDSSTKFSTDLTDKLHIDRQYDVYLDNFTTFDCTVSSSDSTKAAFILSLDQFTNNCSISNKSILQNRIFIQNEHSHGGGQNQTKTHKSKKLNYICSIEPMTIKKISGSLTLLDGSTHIFNNGAGGRFILELVIVPRK